MTIHTSESQELDTTRREPEEVVADASTQAAEAQERPGGWLDRSLASLVAGPWDLEKIAWVILLTVTAIIRLADLGARSMSHDESEHAWFAYNLYAGRGYEHSPVYHGPFAYHVLALFYLLFGDSDITARVPTALFGIGAVWLIWPMRRWIGRFGAFFAAVMVALSPAILHYSRHTRHDIYEIFWALVFVIAVFRYLETDRDRPAKWLYLAAAGLSLILAIKEVSFIYGALVGGFVALLLLVRWIGDRLPGYPVEEAEIPLRLVRQDWIILGAIVVISFLGTLLVRVFGLVDTSYETTGPGGVVQTVVRLLPILVPPIAAVGLSAWHVRRREREGASLPVFSTPTDVAILLGTLILPWLSPFLIDALGYTPLDYSFPVGILRSLSVVAAMAGLAIAVGVWWDWRRWLPAAGIFYAIFILFFTTFFTNGKGWATGLVGSLGYWLSQQEVARGSQPWFYYLVIVPLYEFLPLILSVPVVFGALLRRNRLSTVLLILLLIATALSLITGGMAQPAGEEEANSLLETANLLLRSTALLLAALAVTWGGILGHPRRREHFLAFLPLWVVGTWMAYTIAGEKMPWLTTHIALPMIIAGGWWLGKVVERIDWRTVWQRGGVWIAVLMLPLLAAIVALLRSSPFRDRTIDGLSQTSQWIAALVIGGVVLGLLLRQARKVGWRDALRVAGLTMVLLVGLWSVRTSYMLNFINYDYVSEYLFYAHASPDPRMVMDQLEDMSRRTAGDKQLKIAHDDDSGWPFNWYLRNWPGATYFGANPSREVLAGATAVLIGSKNLDQARPYLSRDYYEFSHRLIWWPDEGYKSASWEKIWQGLTDPARRKEFLDVVIWRKHTQSLAEWPLVHRFSLFVRKDVAAQLWDFGAQPATAAPLTDPYEAGMREIASQQQIGSGPGIEPGQLSFPRNVAVAQDGTVFVADSGNHRIAVYRDDGTFLRTWGSSCDLYAEGQPGCVDPDGSGPLQVGDGQLREPWGIAVGPDGRIYVADTWNHRVVAFDQEGNFLNKWGTFATTDGEAIGSPGAFWGPRAIAVDSVGNLFVTDTGNKRIQVFDAEGNFLGQFGGGGVVEGRFDEPVGLDIVPAEQGVPGGTLYVADTWNRRVQAFDVRFADELSGGTAQPSFVFLREWPVEGWASQSVVNKPYLAVDGEGFVYVTDPENWRVLVFDEQGSFRATFGMYGTDAQSFALPVGIATGPEDRAYVVDSDNHRVQVYGPVR